jgi:hypothetical protein
MLCVKVAVISSRSPDIVSFLRVQFYVAEIGTGGYTAMLCLQEEVISSLSPCIVSFESPV